MKPLGTIEEEARDCRAAFEGVKEGAQVWLCHQSALFEYLIYSAESRITCILEEKSTKEQARRLREFRPVKDVEKFASLYAGYEAKYDSLYADYEAKYDSLYADYEAKCASLDADLSALHLAEYPDTTWDGKDIFGGEK